MTAMLCIDNLSMSFGGITALKEIDLTVNQGEILAIIGPNGSGKTTLLNVITGVYTPDRGRILLNGKALPYSDPTGICIAGIARTFQNVRLFRKLSVLDNVLVGQHHRYRKGLHHILAASKGFKHEEQDFRAEGEEILARVGLAGRGYLLAQNLPYAQQRLLEIARALATRPVILLLDEPAAGMNSEEIQHLGGLIHSLRDSGLTIILIEHIMDLVRSVADRVVVLSYGLKIAAGSFEEIERNPDVITAYLGKRAAERC